MTVLPTTRSEWERVIPLFLILVASGVAWGTLKADVSHDEEILALKADGAFESAEHAAIRFEINAQYQAISDQLKDIQARLARSGR